MNRIEYFEIIVEQAKKIAIEQDLISCKMIGGELQTCYLLETDVFIIKYATNSEALEIVKVSNKNPVLLVNKNGKIYRTHGEIKFIYDSIMNYKI